MCLEPKHLENTHQFVLFFALDTHVHGLIEWCGQPGELTVTWRGKHSRCHVKPPFCLFFTTELRCLRIVERFQKNRVFHSAFKPRQTLIVCREEKYLEREIYKSEFRDWRNRNFSFYNSKNISQTFRSRRQAVSRLQMLRLFKPNELGLECCFEERNITNKKNTIT